MYKTNRNRFLSEKLYLIDLQLEQKSHPLFANHRVLNSLFAKRRQNAKNNLVSCHPNKVVYL